MNFFDTTLINLTLQSELKNFGLNPEEWTLQKSKSFLGYIIRHRLDENFMIYGKLEFKKQKPQWRSLEIVSL